MEKLDSSIIEAITKLRNNKKQPNENNIYTLILKDAKSLAKKDLEERLMTLTKENKILNKPYGGKNSYFTIEEGSDNNSFVTIEFVKENKNNKKLYLTSFRTTQHHSANPLTS